MRDPGHGSPCVAAGLCTCACSVVWPSNAGAYYCLHQVFPACTHGCLLTRMRAHSLATTQEHIFPLLQALVKDHEYVVRQHLAQQIWGLAQVCVDAGSMAGYSAIVEQLLPVLAKLVSDPTPDVRLASGESLIEVAKHIKADDLGPRVLTFVLELAHDDREEELRMTAVRASSPVLQLWPVR